MTTAEVFSFALLLKSPDRIVGVLALLEEEKRAAVHAAVQSLNGVSLPDLRQRWSEQRHAEELAELQQARTKYRAFDEGLPPALAKWLRQDR